MNLQENGAENTAAVPELPRSATEPRLVVITGTIMFAVILVITLLARETFGAAWIVCACGVGAGVLGAAVLTAQRRAALRGDRGAQRGLV